MPVTNLLLLPGLDGTGRLFRGFMHSLPKQVRSKAPIYGEDQFLTFDQLASAVRFVSPESEPFVLLAESFSTPIAIRLAAENPPNLRGLVLCAGFATSPAPGFLRLLGSMLAPVLVRAAITEPSIRFWFVGKDAPGSLVESVRAAISSVSPHLLSERLRAVLACEVRSDLSRVSVPLVYLQASNDRLVKRRSFEEIRRIKPEIQLIEVDGPHFLLQREPEKTAAIIAEFLQTLD